MRTCVAAVLLAFVTFAILTSAAPAGGEDEHGDRHVRVTCDLLSAFGVEDCVRRALHRHEQGLQGRPLRGRRVPLPQVAGDRGPHVSSDTSPRPHSSTYVPLPSIY
ncbi:uncharacterized protein LOC124594032 [Schistocerca americana]|uniref:uncharacterized protein LOC124594032 n=1 Tax=Schistocerca americana TaxID=7009 RepID=UPI001F4F7668|nr:uncharacterized protein LOC124594032 [Schistocerca americana]